MPANEWDHDDAPNLSVVVPLYNEQETLPELYRRLIIALEMLGTFEIVFVDDGSRDATLGILARLRSDDPRLSIVQLSRNFGHQAAVSAGLAHAAGRAVIVMDGDLQDPPEVLGEFIEKWREGYDVVYAIRQGRKEGLCKRLGYYLFYRLLHSVSELEIPLDSGDFCLMDRKAVEVLNHLPEKSRFVRGLRTFIGFRQVGVAYEREARAAGRSKYTFRKLLGLAADGLMGFSNAPLHLVAWLGALSLAGALGTAIWAGLQAGFNPGSSGVLCVVFLMAAVQLFGLAIVGEYVRRIFQEVKARPAYVVQQVWTSSMENSVRPALRLAKEVVAFETVPERRHA